MAKIRKIDFLEKLSEPLHDAHVYLWNGFDMRFGFAPAPCPFHEHESMVMLIDKKMDVLKGACRPRVFYVACSCGARGPFAWTMSEALEHWSIGALGTSIKKHGAK